MFIKGSNGGYLTKGWENKIIGGVKSAVHYLDNPLVGGAISLISPELGAGVAAARSFGIFEKKH